MVEETRVGGTYYLLVTEEEDGEGEAYILKEVETRDEAQTTYLWKTTRSWRQSEKMFAELLDDADIAF